MSNLETSRNGAVGRAIVQALSWVDDRRNVKVFFWVLVGLGAIITLLDLFYKKKTYFDIEQWFGFYSFYGFVMCALLVIAAKVMRMVLMRREDFYGNTDTAAEPHPEFDLDRKQADG